MIGRDLPHNRHTEEVVIAACVRAPECIDAVADVLKAEHFYEASNRVVFGALLDMAARGEEVDAATLVAHLRNRGELELAGGSGEVVDKIRYAEAVSHLDRHARIVRDLWRLREFIKTAEASALKACGAVGDIQGFLDQAEASIRDITEPEKAEAMGTIRDGLDAVWRGINAPKTDASKSKVARTGFDTYDEKTTGWHPGDLVILAGRPGMGKTAAACAAAVNIAAIEDPETHDRPNEIVFFSLEMPREQLSMRMVCAEAGVPIQRLRSREVDGTEVGRLIEATRFLTDLQIHIDETSGADMTPMSIRAKCRRVARDAKGRGHRVAAIFVDHIQIVNVDGAAGKKGNRNDEIGKFTAMMKSLAKELECPIVLLSQLNRAVENTKDKRPGLVHLRDSGNIEQDADNITFAFRQDYYLKEQTPEHRRGLAELIIAKQRNGPTGTCIVEFVAPLTLYRSAKPSQVEGYKLEDDE